MGFWLLLGVFGAAGLVPLLVLVLLVATGQAQLDAALAGMVAVAAASLAAGWVWSSDVHRLRRRLRQVLRPGRGSHSTAPDPRLPALQSVAHEIERLSRALAERAQQIEQLHKADAAIMEALPDPLIVLAADRSVRRANAAARAAFGADIQAVLRHPVLRAAIDRALPEFRQPAIAPQTVSLSLSAPSPREVQAVVLAVDPPLADGGRAIVVLSDRTRERAVERMRADFVANASHELRTPLASLIGFIDTLRGPAADDPPAQARFLGIMAEQAQRMNRLIDDLLSLSRIELTEHQAPADPVDLAELLRRSAAAFEPRLKERRQRLVLDIAPGLPPIRGDADQLAQVAQNLIDNAIKYGRDGGEVGLSLQPSAGNPWPTRPGLVLTVRDDGHGISRIHLPRLTERFYRVDKGRSRAVGGTGLGLAIVKHIVNRHRGQLAITSEEGQGSSFSIWLPAEPVRQVAAVGK